MREEGRGKRVQCLPTLERSRSSLLPVPSSRLSWDLVVDLVSRPGAENMALDSAMLHTAGEGQAFLRLYTWSPGCLSFGRNEPALARYDRTLIEARGLDTVRRPTGGRAVWHEHELTYAVAAPISAFGSVRDAYCGIHHMLAMAVRELGVPATLAPRPTRHLPLDAGACFAAAAGGEVMADGRKLIGSAQVRKGGVLLQHGSILLDGAQDTVNDVTRGMSRGPANATTLRRCLGRPVTPAQVATVVGETAREIWGGRWSESEIRADALLVRQFASETWTWVH